MLPYIPIKISKDRWELAKRWEEICRSVAQFGRPEVWGSRHSLQIFNFRNTSWQHSSDEVDVYNSKSLRRSSRVFRLLLGIAMLAPPLTLDGMLVVASQSWSFTHEHAMAAEMFLWHNDSRVRVTQPGGDGAVTYFCWKSAGANRELCGSMAAIFYLFVSESNLLDMVNKIWWKMGKLASWSLISYLFDRLGNKNPP